MFRHDTFIAIRVQLRDDPFTILMYRAFRNTKDSSRTSEVFEAPSTSTNKSKGSVTDDGRLVESNNSLLALASIFPQIMPEVFREMLTQFSGKSSLEIVVEQLMMHKDHWVRGRWKVPNHESGSLQIGQQQSPSLDMPVECFRRNGYKIAVRNLLSEEFRGLGKSVIDAVLAEQNYSYTRSRLTIQGIEAKSWRHSITKIFSPWRRLNVKDTDSHYMIQWKSCPAGTMKVPELRKTGEVELDWELHQTVLIPLLQGLRAEQAAEDWKLATMLNENAAKDANALHECECCFADMTFEQTAACTTDGHIVCFHCLCQTVNEVVFGQGWGRNIDHQTGQLRCLAPTLKESCSGCIPRELTYRALSQSQGGPDQILKFEYRLADEGLLESQLPLIRCPFCSYAEVDDLYIPPGKCQFRLKTETPFNIVICLLMGLALLPFLAIYSIITFLLVPVSINRSTLNILFSNSFSRLSRLKHFPRRFQCRSPICSQPSCLTCNKSWTDPHICHESAVLSLRTTIESARTAALKRTCPRCSLGFIKESGCNKLTCVCGYTMCYVCRQGLGKGEGGEGYRHFCQHFRPLGGKCSECDKCDLYRSEDEDRIVKAAGEEAEREWRKRTGMVGVEGLKGGSEDGKEGWWETKRTFQGWFDVWVQGLWIC